MTARRTCAWTLCRRAAAPDSDYCSLDRDALRHRGLGVGFLAARAAAPGGSARSDNRDPGAQTGVLKARALGSAPMARPLPPIASGRDPRVAAP